MTAELAPASVQGHGGEPGSVRPTGHTLLAPRRHRQYWSGALRTSGDQTTLALSGELDLECQVGLAALLTRTETLPHMLVVDLSAVTYADSYGLGVLFKSASRRREARLPALLLSGPRPFLARVLSALGAERVLDTEHGELRLLNGPPAAWYAC
jgi:anti-anti-sigma factor